METRSLALLVGNEWMDMSQFASGIPVEEDGVPIKTISERCGLAITSLTTMLERMEKSGLIIRQQDSGDKRKTLLFLTEKAKALKEDYDSISDRMSDIFYQGFTEDEIRTFEDHLERIRLNLEGWQPE